MSKYYVVSEEETLFVSENKEEAEAYADQKRDEAINAQLEEWGDDVEDCSEERRNEAAWAIGANGQLFEVMDEKALRENDPDL